MDRNKCLNTVQHDGTKRHIAFGYSSYCWLRLYPNGSRWKKQLHLHYPLILNTETFCILIYVIVKYNNSYYFICIITQFTKSSIRDGPWFKNTWNILKICQLKTELPVIYYICFSRYLLSNLLKKKTTTLSIPETVLCCSLFWKDRKVETWVLVELSFMISLSVFVSVNMKEYKKLAAAELSAPEGSVSLKGFQLQDLDWVNISSQIQTAWTWSFFTTKIWNCPKS